MVWNGLIDIANTEFLPQSIWINAFVIMNFWEEQASIGDILKLTGCCSVLLLIVIGLAIHLGKSTNDEYLNLSYFEKIKTFTENTNMLQMKNSETIMR